MKIKMKITAFAVALIMIFAAIPAAVLAADGTEPKAYDSVSDGELLYKVDFASKNFVVGRGNTYMRYVASLTGVRNGSTLRLGYENVTKRMDNHCMVGTIPSYSLAEKTYTIDLDFSAQTPGKRAKVYFGFGQFAEEEGTPKQQPLALEINYGNRKPFRMMRDTTTMADENTFHNIEEFLTETQTSHLKIVLSGAAESDGKVKVDYEIYSVGAYENEMILKQGAFVSPSANAVMTLGIGEWNALNSEGQAYSISNVAIYRGDTSAPAFKFQNRYEAASYGTAILKLDTYGIGDETKNNVNEYTWTQKDSGVTVDTDGYVYCNPTEDGVYGVTTAHPFANEWSYGYYTMEFALNSDRRCAIGLVDIGNLQRVGFGFGANSERKMQEDGITPVVDDTRYLGQTFSQGDKMFDSSEDEAFAAVEGTGVRLITYKADAQRIVTGNKVNVKIEFDSVKKLITLFERTSDTWVKVSAIDYSGVESLDDIKPIFSLSVADAGANIIIKNIKYFKGLSLTHLVRYSAGDVRSEIYYDADVEQMNAVIDAYKAKYALEGNDISGWSHNGTTATFDLETLYSGLDEQFYGLLDLKLMPIINYGELTDVAAPRGIRLMPVKDGKYGVNFVAAVGSEIENLKEVGFDIVKVTEGENGALSVENITVNSWTLCKKLNCDGVAVDAEVFGGDYVFAATISGQIAQDGVQTDYRVTPFVMTEDGAKTSSGSTRCFTFVGGEYSPATAALELPEI